MQQMQGFAGTCSGFSRLRKVWPGCPCFGVRESILLPMPRLLTRLAGNTVDLSRKRFYAQIRVEE
jgi:hypothetical protein